MHVVVCLCDDIDCRNAIRDLDHFQHDRVVAVADVANLQIDPGKVPAFGEGKGLRQRVDAALAGTPARTE